MTNDIKVSIIMPVYNSGIYLRTAVDSILTQSMKEFELILVDDGSSDGSEKVCDEYAQAHPEGSFPIVRVIHQKNGRICKARNAGLSIARGEYIGFSDHDDEYLPEFMETAYSKAKQYNADVVKWREKDIYISKKGRDEREARYYGEERCMTKDEIKRDFVKLLNVNFYGYIWDGLYRKEFLLNNNLTFNESFKYGFEDVEMNLRIVVCNPRVVVLPQVFYHHNLRSSFSTSRKFMPQLRENWYTLQRMLNHTIERLGVDKDATKQEYIRYVISNFVVMILNDHIRDTSKYSRAEMKDEIKRLRSNDYLPPYFYDESVEYIFKERGKTAAVTYYLLKKDNSDALVLFYWLKWICEKLRLAISK